MQTRAKSDIFKPKVYQSSLTSNIASELRLSTIALTDPTWKEAMNSEIQALHQIKHGIWFPFNHL